MNSNEAIQQALNTELAKYKQVVSEIASLPKITEGQAGTHPMYWYATLDYDEVHAILAKLDNA